MINLLLSILGAYTMICFGGWFLHRYFIYVPDPARYAPSEAGLPDVEEVVFEGEGGAKLIAWHLRAKGQKPTLLYFTGNAGSVANRAAKIEAIAAGGYGVFIMNYRGYGGSSGWPSETNNVSDAVSAYDTLRGLGVPARDIVAYGESLGTSVATQLALKRSVQALVLESPFTNIVDVGRQVWWFLPLGLIMTDQYRTLDYISSVKVPLFIVHGERDGVIPIAHARRVYAAANEPKELAILPAADHNDLFENGAWERVDTFLKSLGAKPETAGAPSQLEPAAVAP
jgi:fermentation-respiration switch protein FrsA (DUF1100 family)